jgi:PDZ domain
MHREAPSNFHGGARRYHVLSRWWTILVGIACLTGIDGRRLIAQETQPGRIRAFLALDAGSRLWGLDQNATRIEFLLQMIAPNSGAVDVQAIPQARITPAGLIGYFNALNDVKPTDVLIFYYAGHGATDQRIGHFFQTSAGDLPRSELRAAIMQKRPRLAVMLTDCCSSAARFRPPKTPPAPGATAPGAPPGMSKLMRCLFFEHRGLVDITGATYDARTGKGEFGWYGPQGGVFTTALSDALLFSSFEEIDASHDGFVTWTEFDRTLRKLELQTFNRYKQDRLREAAASPDDDKKTVKLLLDQPAQTPQAFSLGVASGGSPAGEHLAGNVGVYYEMKPYQSAVGARLTRPSVPGSPAASIGLEPGDMIISLDDIPLREPIDFQLHYARTSLVFINIRTGQPQTAELDLGPSTVIDHYAANLGIYYVLYPYGGSMGARLTRYPVAGTACAGLRLEPGDMIVSLDGLPIRTHADVANHFEQTTLQFINVRTGEPSAAEVNLPVQTQPGAGAPPE